MSKDDQSSLSNPSTPKGKSPAEVLTARITLIGTIVASLLGVVGVGITAYFGYLGIRTQVEAPIHATQTSEAKLATLPKLTQVPRPSTTPVPLTCNLALADDFSNKTAWGDEKAGWAEWGHTGSEYQMKINQPHSLLKRCGLCKQKAISFRATVTSRVAAGSGTWGIYFFDVSETWYSVEVDLIGNVEIRRYNGYNSTILGQGLGSIQTTNHLQVDSIDKTVIAYLNGLQVSSAQIAPPSVGTTTGFGLISTTQEPYPFDVRFDNFSFHLCQ